MKNLFYLVIFSAFLSSCISTEKLVYFQSKKFSKRDVTLIENKRSEYRIQPNDVLSIKVASILDRENSDIFDFNPGGGGIGGNNPAASLYFTGYSVDESGSIVFPTVGKLKVSGLTIDEVRDLVQQNVNKYLTNATVLAKIVSFKVTILGDVRSPGYYFVYNNQATLPEVLGLAGDLTGTGNRKNVKLIRQTANGTEVVLLDLTDPNVIKSPYYYMLPNDVLYVEPLRAQLTRSNLTTLGIVFSAITTSIVVFQFILNNR
jgi:polysaccharide biosynthesis/export protein